MVSKAAQSVIVLLAVFLAFAEAQDNSTKEASSGEESKENELEEESKHRRVKPSPCMENCIGDLVKMPRDINYVITKLDEVCDAYIEAGQCIEKECIPELAPMFARITTFHRINCIDMREKIEPHLECLSKASENVQAECAERCRQHRPSYIAKLQSVEDDKEKAIMQLEESCNVVVCTSKCTYEKMATPCPQARDALMKLNVRYADEAASGTPQRKLLQAPDACQCLHNGRKMKKLLLLKSDKAQDWDMDWIANTIPKMDWYANDASLSDLLSESNEEL